LFIRNKQFIFIRRLFQQETKTIRQKAKIF